MRVLLAALFSLLLAACASAPPVAPDESLWRDDQFAPPTVRIDREQIFALDDSMRTYLRTDMAAFLRQEGVQRGLVMALYGQGLLRLDYDSTMTRNAAQAFEARAGNCLSLVLMTAAFAKELNLPVRYESAYADETWARSGQLVFRSGHVNVTVAPRPAESGAVHRTTDYTVDFLPPGGLQRMYRSEIGEDTVVAMYFNNRAAEALSAGDLDNAYWWAREAIRTDPGFVSAVNTLGVIYVQRGDTAAAERAFVHVLGREPDHTRAMANLAYALQQAQRHDEAALWQRRLAQLEPHPPFHWFDLGRAAWERGDVAAARDLFAREVDRMPYYHEFHFWLAQADFRLGDLAQARRHLQAARDQSTNPRDQGIYAAKLAWLKDRQSH